jgi:hypothetical protein
MKTQTGRTWDDGTRRTTEPTRTLTRRRKSQQERAERIRVVIQKRGSK